MYSKKIKIKTLNLKNSSLDCHTLAERAYDSSLNIDYQYDSDLISKNTIDLISAMTPIHVVTESKEYKFFAGWSWVSLCMKYNCENVNLIVHTNISDEEIELCSWLYFHSMNLKQIDNESYLAHMYNCIDKTPTSYIRKIFGNNYHADSSNKLVQQLSGKPRTSIINQLEKKRLQKKSSDYKSLPNNIFG